MADAETDPRTGDRITIGGVTYSVVNVIATQPGGVVLKWDVEAKRA